VLSSVYSTMYHTLALTLARVLVLLLCHEIMSESCGSLADVSETWHNC